MLVTINRNVHYRWFHGAWVHFLFAFGAVVYKLQARESYIESLHVPLVPKVKGAGSLKVKGLPYNCLLAS